MTIRLPESAFKSTKTNFGIIIATIFVNLWYKIGFMHKGIKTVGLSTLGAYGLLKLPMQKVDPYTRMSVGIGVGASIALYGAINKNPFITFLGVGVIIGGALTFHEAALFGAKIMSNEYSGTVYALHETDADVREIKPFEVPDYRIDGLAIKGMNGVFKAHNGVYLKILADGSIIPTFGLGGLVNKLGAGFKSRTWVDNTCTKGDCRWGRLFERSV